MDAPCRTVAADPAVGCSALGGPSHKVIPTSAKTTTR
jgi:hypothetical protein